MNLILTSIRLKRGRGNKRTTPIPKAPPATTPAGRKRKRKKKDLSSDTQSDSDAETDYRNGNPKSTKRSHLETIGFNDLDTNAGNSVYRALKEGTTPFAWTESPCGVCPSFEFCKPGGPVNPQECVYYGDWLTGGTVSNEIEE